MKSLLQLFSWLVSFSIKSKINEITEKGKIVCMYGHNPNRESFENLVSWFLKNNFKFITADNLIEHIIKNNRVTEKYVWLSFDDGWKENYTNVLPVIEKFKIPVTFFISTKPVESGYFWWTKAQNHLLKLKINNFDHLWNLPNSDRVKMIEQINKDNIKREALSISEVQSLSKSNYVTIGNHTDDHVNCLNCSKAELIKEIITAQNKIKEWTGITTKYFAYPGGNRNKNTTQLIKQLEFKIGASVKQNLATLNDDILDLPRTCIKNNPVSLTENIVMALGIRQQYVTHIGSFINTINRTRLKKYLAV